MSAGPKSRGIDGLAAPPDWVDHVDTHVRLNRASTEGRAAW